ncbi:class I SAM-dependent methyltransferase [Desulfobacterales bacterium HSG17]|nr:class I SAM-dependent methyltransferase [Desulfobacterales bacterium HSG17]
MKTKEASRSAGIIAAHRAIHSSKNSNERICYDPFAKDFLPTGFTVIGKHEISEESALELFNAIVPGFHEFFLARTRYIDDYLQNCINKGLEQLVILGAGYDSRAYRFDELKKKIKVFEVDHPATQNVKKEKLIEIFQMLPKHVTYVPIDFQKETLRSCLSENGYDHHQKTLFIWEGVTMYIDQKAVDETLLFISKNTGNGSSVVFDYTYPEVIDGTYERKEAKEWLKITENSDEPIFFGIRNDNIEKFLTDRGFCNVTNVSSEYFNANYYTGVNKNRESTPVFSIAHAVVKKSSNM